MKYRIPLLETDGNNIIFKGKTLTLPLDKKFLSKLKKERYDLGFSNPKLGRECGLFCQISGKKYLLAINNIIFLPESYNFKAFSKKYQQNKLKHYKEWKNSSKENSKYSSAIKKWTNEQENSKEKILLESNNTRIPEIVDVYKNIWKENIIFDIKRKSLRTYFSIKRIRDKITWWSWIRKKRKWWKLSYRKNRNISHLKNNIHLQNLKNRENLFIAQLKSRLDKEYSKLLRAEKQAIRINIKGRLYGANMSKKFMLTHGSLNRQSFNLLQYKQKDIKTPWGLFGLRLWY